MSVQINNRQPQLPRIESPTSTPVQTPTSTPVPAAPASTPDTFGDTPLAERGRAFAAAFSSEPADPSTTPVSELAPSSDAQARAAIGSSVDRAIDGIPGTVGPEARERIRTTVVETAAAMAGQLGVGLDAVDKIDVNFNVNGSVVSGGLGATVYPPAHAGAWSTSMGVGTPNVPGASVSVALGFNTGSSLLGSGTAINGRVTAGLPGIGDVSIKGGTDGGISVERDVPGLSVGGGLPGVGIELNVPLADVVAQAERLTGMDHTSLMHQANRLTIDAHTRSEAEYRERQQAVNAEYDALLRTAETPELRSVIDRERNERLYELQRQQNENYAIIESMYGQMVASINRR